ncbi:kinesin-like protein KIF18B [Camarhynchus parvulus]|uniref:kinesin-like protein KIF18B n=1 Tax=Geospiza parvula TaxID=87175 RepID=UPI001237F4A9|nr:kinesin-like protein KIF18B [Camarhynchus parvulus]
MATSGTSDNVPGLPGTGGSRVTTAGLSPLSRAPVAAPLSAFPVTGAVPRPLPGHADPRRGSHEDPDQWMGSPEQPDAPAPGACWGAEPPPQEGSMAVVLRVRPPNPRERAAPSVLHVLNQRAVLFASEEPGGTGTGPGRRRRNLEFEFDHVFGERATQEEVFQHTTLPLLDTLLAGYNCSVFAYGASGVGKTHTMMGSKSTPGIVHLATVELYKRLEAMKDRSCEVLVSYQQVYKERVYDLLKPQGPLNIWEQPGKGVVAQGLSLHQPTTPEQLLGLLAKGNKNRAQRSTKANAASSRSHAIFQIQVKHWDLTGGDPHVAKLSFIDLAGSERAWDTPGRGEGMWEGTSINRSLLAFKSVVRALAGAKGGQCHVPFRDSKLTLLLKDSLVGSFRSTVIAAVSPAAPAGPDTYSTLRFASRARHILLPVSTGRAPAARERLPAGRRVPAEAPVTTPDPPVPSTAPQSCQELSPCSSPKPISVWPVKRMLESSSDSQTENSCGSRTRRKRQRGCYGWV